MSLKKIVLTLGALLVMGTLSAQQWVATADFETRFDNREYSGNVFNESQTLFSARLAPKVGIEWQEHNRLIVGVDMLQNFGQHNGEREPFLSDIKPLMYYRFKNAKVEARAGIFERSALEGEYSPAFFSDSTRFYQNRICGFLGRYRSAVRPDTYVEFALDWEGMLGPTTRERFRIITGGRYALSDKFYFGYALTLFHFAMSQAVDNVSDNMLVNPFVGYHKEGKYAFDIKAGWLVAPQRGRSVDNAWKTPCGGQLDIKLCRWGLKFENILYVGENLQPLRHALSDPDAGLTYGSDGLYAGDSFYSTTEHIYNRTWLGYQRRFFKDTLGVEAGILFHYDGVGLGTSQVVQISVNLDKVFKNKKQ